MPEQLLLRKTAFAGLCGVTHGRVAQWIAEGKISGEALVNRGRIEMIDANLAREQLKERLDVKNRFSLSGLSTRLDDYASQERQERLPLEGGSIESQIKAEKLRHAQLQTSRLEEEDRARRGVYVEAATARAEMTRIAADLLRSFEGALPDFASAVAAKFQVPQRDALHLLRGEFRRLRERAAATHAKAASNEPKWPAPCSYVVCMTSASFSEEVLT